MENLLLPLAVRIKLPIISLPILSLKDRIESSSLRMPLDIQAFAGGNRMAWLMIRTCVSGWPNSLFAFLGTGTVRFSKVPP